MILNIVLWLLFANACLLSLALPSILDRKKRRKFQTRGKAYVSLSAYQKEMLREKLGEEYALRGREGFCEFCGTAGKCSICGSEHPEIA